jgi:hypothetical protein
MKRYISFFAIILCLSGVQAQEVSDAMRYAQENITGTARFRAMGGAFGALGGDMSAISVNPAGSAIFVNNQLSVTLSNYNTKNKSNYYGTLTNERDNSFDLNQIGGVFVFENRNEKSDWKKFALSVNYENQNSFDNTLFSAGTNPSNSISNYFLQYANSANGGNAIPIELVELQNNESISELYGYLASLPDNDYPNIKGFEAQQAFLGYQAFLYDYDDTTTPMYLSNVPAGDFYQENYFVTTGYSGKATANFSSQYKDRFSFGLNLNIHFTDYRKASSVSEINNNDPINGVQKITFENDLYTYGNGFSFNLGTIVKLTNELRVGLAYQSPTWHELNDQLQQRLTTVSQYGPDRFDDNVNPYVINIYEPYKIQTPGKLTGSMAYVFGKRGIISFDYSLKDYSNTSFKPKTDAHFGSLNQVFLNNARENSSEYRVGGEYKINQFSLRAGYRFEQSPYKDNTIIGNLTGYSGGLGYSFGNTKLDLAYSFSKRDYKQQFLSQGMTDNAIINTKNNNVTATLSFEL